MAAVPQASHAGPVSGALIRGYAANRPTVSPLSAISAAITRLRDSSVSGEPPTESSQLASKKSHPSSSASIQQASLLDASLSLTGAIEATRDPNSCSAAGAGRGFDAKIDHSFAPDSPEVMTGSRAVKRTSSDT